MLGPIDYALWLAGFLMELAAVACIVYRKAFAQYYAVAGYMFCAALVQGIQFASFSKYGVDSRQYYYAYYYLDNLLAILLFFVVIQFSYRVFGLMNASRYVRGATFLLLAGAAIISYVVVHGHKDHLTSQFVVEFDRNLYFVGVVLTYLLWIVIVRLREKPPRLVMLVLGLGIYFSVAAGIYALRNLFPTLEGRVLLWGPPANGVWLPLAWTYAFLRTPEEPQLTSPAGVGV